MTKLATALAVVISFAAAGSAAAQQTPAPAAVEWLLPPAPPVKPQTDDEKQRGMSSGRDLPPLELLQPTLDPGLPAYQPRTGAKLQGHFKAAASDVLPASCESVGRRVSRLPSGRAHRRRSALRRQPRRQRAREGQPRLRVRLARAQARRHHRFPHQVRLRSAERPGLGRQLPALRFPRRRRFHRQQRQSDRTADVRSARRAVLEHALPRCARRDDLGRSRSRRRVGEQARAPRRRQAVERIRGVHPPARAEHARSPRRMARRHRLLADGVSDRRQGRERPLRHRVRRPGVPQRAGESAAPSAHTPRGRSTHPRTRTSRPPTTR